MTGWQEKNVAGNLTSRDTELQAALLHREVEFVVMFRNENSSCCCCCCCCCCSGSSNIFRSEISSFSSSQFPSSPEALRHSLTELIQLSLAWLACENAFKLRERKGKDWDRKVVVVRTILYTVLTYVCWKRMWDWYFRGNGNKQTTVLSSWMKSHSIVDASFEIAAVCSMRENN